jgi:hypothetical protein
MSLFASINKTADTPAVDVYAEELERERARRAAQAQLDAEEAAEKARVAKEEAAEKARVAKEEAEAEAIRKANEPKFYTKEDIINEGYRTRLLGYPMKLAAWGVATVGVAGVGLSLAIGELPFVAVCGIGGYVGYKVTNRIANWLIGKRKDCKLCGAKNDWTVTVEQDGVYTHTAGDRNYYETLTVTTCNGCGNFNRLSEKTSSLTAEASARISAENAARRAQRDAENAADKARRNAESETRRAQFAADKAESDRRSDIKSHIAAAENATYWASRETNSTISAKRRAEAEAHKLRAMTR